MPRRARSHSGQAPQPPQELTSATASSRAKAVLRQTLGAAQQVRVAQRALAQGAREHLLDLLLAGDAVEHGRPQPPSRRPASATASSAAASTSAATMSTSRKPSIRRTRSGKAPRQHGEAGGDALLEIEAFGLDAVGRAAGARQPDQRIDVEDDREVGQQAAQTRAR